MKYFPLFSRINRDGQNLTIPGKLTPAHSKCYPLFILLFFYFSLQNSIWIIYTLPNEESKHPKSSFLSRHNKLTKILTPSPYILWRSVCCGTRCSLPKPRTRFSSQIHLKKKNSLKQWNSIINCPNHGCTHHSVEK